MIRSHQTTCPTSWSGSSRPSTTSSRREAAKTWMPATSAGMTAESVIQFDRTQVSLPDRPRRFDHPRKLRALVGLRHRVAGNRRGKAALRADRKAIEVDELRRFLDPAHQ